VPTQVLTSQGPFVFTVLGTINSAGEVVCDLTTVAAGSLAIANNLSELTATADTALGNLGATAVGIDLLQATDEAGARAVLGSTVVGDAVFIASSTTVAQTALGGTATGRALFTAASASAARTTLEMTLSTMTAVAPVAVTTAGAIYLQVPTGITGTVSLITGVTNGNPGGNVVFASAIGTSGGAYSAITSGGFTVANGATAGTRSVATPSAANAVTGGTSIIRVSWDNGAATACLVGLTIEITRS
jgi:hypothetical protein